MGFEPTVRLATHTRFPSVLLKPLGHLSVPTKGGLKKRSGRDQISRKQPFPQILGTRHGGMSALPLRFLTPFTNRFSRRCGTPQRLGVEARRPANFPQRAKFAYFLGSLSSSRNPARSPPDDLLRLYPSPLLMKMSGFPRAFSRNADLI